MVQTPLELNKDKGQQHKKSLVETAALKLTTTRSLERRDLSWKGQRPRSGQEQPPLRQKKRWCCGVRYLGQKGQPRKTVKTETVDGCFRSKETTASVNRHLYLILQASTTSGSRCWLLWINTMLLRREEEAEARRASKMVLKHGTLKRGVCPSPGETLLR